MSWTRWIRQVHRWMSVLFTAGFVANLVAMGVVGEPPMWITLSPLPPLMVLLATGLYLFALPWVTRLRRQPAT